MNRLLYLSDSRLPSEKANGYQVMKMCEAFAQQRVEVELVYPFRFQMREFAVPASGDPFAYYPVARNFRLKRLPNLDTIPLAMALPPFLRRMTKPQFIHFVSYALAAFLHALPLFRSEKLLFYGRSEYTFAFLTRVRAFVRPKLLFEAHGFPGQWGREFRLNAMRKLDGLVVVTNALRDRYIDAGVPRERILIAHDAVDLALFTRLESQREARRQLGLPEHVRIIGYIGRFQTMGMEKGILTLIESLPYLRMRTEESYHVVFVGGPLEVVGTYRDRMTDLGVLSERVHFIDRRPPEEVPLWIRACDVVTIPFPRTTHLAYYASPMKLFEYLAGGTPIVATNLPALAEILRDGENAVLVEPENPQAFAEGLWRVLSNPAFATTIATAARRTAAECTWARRAERILQFAESLPPRS